MDVSTLPLTHSDADEIADDTTLHKAYSALLAALHLSDDHKEQLADRGLDGAQVADANFRTLPLRNRAQLVKQIGRELGTGGLDDVPGFYINRGGYGEYPTIAGSPGLMIPVRSADGDIVGVQLRPDDPPGDAKYIWLSSNGKKAGTAAKARVHHSQLGDPDGRLWLTEGVLKADVLAALGDVRVIGSPGATQTRALVEAAIDATDAGDSVVVAFDADWRDNRNVRGAIVRLATELQANDRRVLIADWATFPTGDDGKARPSGIDDALHAGAPVTLHPVDADLFSERSREISPVDLPDETPATDDLATAEAKIRDRVLTLLRAQQPGVTVFADQPGVGKTRQTALAVKQATQSEDWPTVDGKKERPARAAFLTDTIEHAEQVAEQIGPTAALVQGRSSENCIRSDQTHKLGNARHNVTATACAYCKSEWEAKHKTEWSCPYINSRERAREKPVTVAAKSAYINASDELGDFAVVIIDEELEQHLLDSFELNRDRVDDWIARMDAVRAADIEDVDARGGIETADRAIRYGDDHPQRRLLRLLQRATVPPAPEGDRPERRHLLDALRQIADAEGEDLDEIVRECRQIEPHHATGLHPFERPRADTGDLVEIDGRIPLRAFADLVGALVDELDRPADADTRLWIERRHGASGAILVYIPRHEIIGALRNTTTLVLNAHPDIDLLHDVFGRQPDVVKADIPENVHITQLSNSLYTGQQLEDESSRETLREARHHFAEDHDRTVTLAPKAVAEELDADGHFGFDDRAHNRWEGADALAILGHWQRPIDEVEAEVQALRFADKPPEPDPGAHCWRAYLHVDDDGKSLARLRPVHPDPDIQHRLDFERRTLIQQAIGRLRPVRSDGPVHVLIADADPVPGLRVDELVTAREYLGRSIGRKRLQALADANAERHRALQSRVLQVIAGTENVAELTVRGLQRELADRGYARSRRDRLAPMLRAVQLLAAHVQLYGKSSINTVVTADFIRKVFIKTDVTTPCNAENGAVAKLAELPVVAHDRDRPTGRRRRGPP